ncbi:sigma-70 family RNA polymerase sigma factor [Pyxidicoccus parkwayensis]|uniref:Sigma-70 family RNA polymerase sigma factor n=1 Tax=Pyxidicoccus parkwayensis TaxID=2813578 RepID=A0ABX7NVP1_9BACT|nr:sigma-70 family RNA polymerase sigma factor [Pyxidicoccus parkwaysis]QSQ22997.1 sigma-70 family RNA polymerase sigma factor [Pyxidicoccus parkwaysis]
MTPMSQVDISTLYRRHVALVRGCALRILGEPAAAEDVAQEAFIRFLQHRERSGSEQDTAAFLYRTSTNLALNRLRDARRRQGLHDAHLPDEEPRSPHSPEDGLALRKVLAEADPEQAQIAACYFIHGMEHEEIAGLLGVPRRTVGRRLEKFRAHAEHMLRGEGRKAAGHGG